MPPWLWYVIGVVAVGLVFDLASKTARKIIRNIHETQARVDTMTWEVRGRSDALQGAVSDIRAEVARVVDGLSAMEQRLGQAAPPIVTVASPTSPVPVPAATPPAPPPPRDLDLLPCTWEAKAGTVVLYGVGDGRDLADLCAACPTASVVALDRDPRSLGRAAEVASRADLRLVLADGRLPLADASADVIECPRLHLHPDDAAPLLAEFRRVLKPHGRVRIGLLDADSVWMHLYVGYVRGVLGAPDGRSEEEAFVRSVLVDATDDAVQRALDLLQPARFAALARAAGFTASRHDRRASLRELALLPRRPEALLCDRLPARHADFLRALRLDGDGRPVHGGVIALHELRPA